MAMIDAFWRLLYNALIGNFEQRVGLCLVGS